MEWIFACVVVFILALPFVVGVLIGWYFLGGKDAIAANQFKRKVFQLNPLKGKTLEQIRAALGPESSWAALGSNRASRSWNRRKYYITLIFQDEVCEGVSTEINI